MSKNYIDKAGLSHAISKIMALMLTGLFAFTTDDSGNLYAETPDIGQEMTFEITADGDININF